MGFLLACFSSNGEGGRWASFWRVCSSGGEGGTMGFLLACFSSNGEGGRWADDGLSFSVFALLVVRADDGLSFDVLALLVVRVDGAVGGQAQAR